MSFAPMTFRYRDGDKTKTVKADGISWSSKGGAPSWIHLSLDKKLVAEFPESKLLPGYKEKARKLYGRYWLQKLLDLKNIRLFYYDDFHSRLGGLPDDLEEVWYIGGLPDGEYWVMQCKDRTILHIMNNDEVEAKGKFEDALKELFPGKTIRYYVPTVKECVVHEEKIVG